MNSGVKTPGQNPLTAWFRPKLKIDEPPPIQVPDKLVDERDLSIKYARWMVETGRLKEAKEKYQMVLRKNPKDVEAIIGMAKIDELTGRPSEAEAGYLKAVQISPDAAVPQCALGEYFASQKRWPEAIDCYNRAVLADPIDRKSRFELAKALVHHGDVEGALPHFIRTVGDAEAHFNTAVILREEGRVKEAEDQLRIAVAKKPELTQAKLLLAEMSRPQRRGLTHDTEFQRASHQDPEAAPIVNPAPAPNPGPLSSMHSAAGNYVIAEFNN
ncbi:MAG TPA: tetratricopeptide repeat protein [Caulifigura sp.]|nr:tetratricopeptide repeat protein [Caulifigura sp.]